MDTRTVSYLLTEDHVGHRLSYAHTGSANCGRRLRDGGLSFPKAVMVVGIFCHSCGYRLTPGRDYRVEDRFEFEIEDSHEEKEPWRE